MKLDLMRLNPFAPRPRGGSEDIIERITTWARRAALIDTATSISVTELACAEPGCPPLETVVVVMARRGGGLKLHIYKPMSEVAEDDVLRALQKAEAVIRPGGTAF